MCQVTSITWQPLQILHSLKLLLLLLMIWGKQSLTASAADHIGASVLRLCSCCP
jgi:hypothetical protein